MPASATTYLWLTDAGVLTTGAAFPTSPHVRLARVVAGSATITQVVDQRVQCASRGAGAGFVLKSADTINGPLSVAPGSGTPVLSVDPAGRTVGFFGVTPNTQAPTQAPLIDGTTGTVTNTIGSVGTSYSATQINNNF